MKKELNLVIILLLSLAFVNTLKAQNLTGRLTYYFEQIDTSGNKLLRDLMGGSYEKTFENVILIDKNRYFSKSITESGYVRSMCIQTPDSAYIKLNDKTGVSKMDYYAPLLGNKKGDNYVLISKTKEVKWILGFKCLKYIYRTERVNSNLHNNGLMYAWIPENFKFSAQYLKGKFMTQYIFPDGLAFERETIYKNILTNRHTLVKIEIFEATDEDFNNFEKP
jgi:hypothetical protein